MGSWVQWIRVERVGLFDASRVFATRREHDPSGRIGLSSSSDPSIIGARTHSGSMSFRATELSDYRVRIPAPTDWVLRRTTPMIMASVFSKASISSPRDENSVFPPLTPRFEKSPLPMNGGSKRTLIRTKGCIPTSNRFRLAPGGDTPLRNPSMIDHQ